MRAIVLSGGGSKGSYQIGVWKALKKLHIKYDIVTGTSVGSLNAAFMTQNTYKKAVKLYKHTNMYTLFGEDIKRPKNNKELIKIYSTNLKNGGMDVTNFGKRIKEYLNIKKFYKSKIKFALVTYNRTDKKGLVLTKDKIRKNRLADYLIASCTVYPAFPYKRINGKDYIDGGFYDNLPINAAIDLGADEIIAIDLKAPGIHKKPKKKVKTITIKPNNKLSNFLLFKEDILKINMKYGYNDTLKAFHKAEGKKYTFKNHTISTLRYKNEKQMLEIYNKVLKNPYYISKFRKAINSNKDISTIFKKSLYIKIIESLARSFNIDDTKIYSYKKLNKLFKKELKKRLRLKTREKDPLISMYKKLDRRNFSLVRKEAFINPLQFLESVYLYSITHK